MPEYSYWKALASNAIRKFQEEHNAEAVLVIKKSVLRVELNNHDNWNGGIDYWDLIFELKYRDFAKIESRKNELESELTELLDRFHVDDYNPIANVLIQPAIEQYIDWQAVLPETKQSTLELIEAEHRLLEAIATGKSYKDDGVEECFQQLHGRILRISKLAGFDYPIVCNSLPEWWAQVKNVGGYSDRRVYISQLYTPVVELLSDSEEIEAIDFSRITTRSEAVKKAVHDAEVFIREGVCDSSVDRVHTAFHGYLEQVLIGHGENLGNNESLTALYSKLHSYYAGTIQPSEVGDRIKTILRSGSGMVNAINELRNNNTIAHPNGQLIQEREARLVIRLVNAIVDYIEDVEDDFN